MAISAEGLDGLGCDRVKLLALLLPVALALAVVPAQSQPGSDLVDEVVGGLQPYTPPPTPLIDVNPFLVDYKSFVKTFPKRQNNHPNHVAARNAVAAEFAGAGLTVWRQSFTNGINQENVCAAKLSTLNPDVWVVVGGHLDSTSWDGWAVGASIQPAPLHLVSEGAYDDGSGTRLVVALAEAYAPLDLAFSTLFCTFDGEERGLQGSLKVKQAMDGTIGGFPWPVGDVRGMMNLDMYGIGWPVRAPTYADVNSVPLRNQINTIRANLGIPTNMFKFQGISLGQSDYAHWYNAGIPTIFYISDFQELGVPATNNVPPNVFVPATPNGAYPFWHHDDTWETMLVMTGGDAALAASFQTALKVTSETLSVLALHPEIAL